MRSYIDPHYKPDRDHKKIMADKRRDEEIRAELERGLQGLMKPIPPDEVDPRTPDVIFAAYRIAEKRAAFSRQTLRRGRGSVRNTRTGPRKKRHVVSPSIPVRSIETIIGELIEAETKFATLIKEIERTFATRRERLLRERMAHQKAKILVLRSELHRAGGDLLDVLNDEKAHAGGADGAL